MTFSTDQTVQIQEYVLDLKILDHFWGQIPYKMNYFEFVGNTKIYQGLPSRLNLHTKGQLISKCLISILNFPKKQTKKFDFTTMVPQVELFLLVFRENWRHKKDISKLTDLYHIYFDWYIFFEIKSLLHHLHLFTST